MTNNEIREEVRKILHELGEINPAIDIVKIAKSKGVENIFDVPWELLEGNSGKIQAKDNNKFDIWLNQSDSRYRKRFTVAHELGHLLAGHMNGCDVQGRNPNSPTNQCEKIADAYAAELIMPYFILEALWKIGVRRTDDFAKIFEVSEVAMQYRLDNCRQELES